MIHCPKCGRKLEPNKGSMEKHELYDQTKDSGYELMVAIVCPESPDREYSIIVDEKIGG